MSTVGASCPDGSAQGSAAAAVAGHRWQVVGGRSSVAGRRWQGVVGVLPVGVLPAAAAVLTCRGHWSCACACGARRLGSPTHGARPTGWGAVRAGPAAGQHALGDAVGSPVRSA